MTKELCGERLTNPARSFRTEADTKGRTPGRLIGKTRQNQERSPGILTSVAGAFEEFDRHRAAIDRVNNPPGLMAEATRRPTGDHLQMPAQTQIFLVINIH